MAARAKHLKSLGLTENADDTTIKKAFRKLALMYHPDRNPTNVEEATERFKQINEANTYLTSVAGRARTPPTPAPARREPQPARPPPRARPNRPHRPPPSDKPDKPQDPDEADLRRAQRHHAAAEARRQVQERETRRRATAAAAKKREADDLAAQMDLNAKREKDRRYEQRKDSINAAKAREAERERQQHAKKSAARYKKEREEEQERRKEAAEERAQEKVRRERFEVHAREAREREQLWDQAQREKLRRSRFEKDDDGVETHDMTEDDEAWWRAQQKCNTRGMSGSAWREEEEDPEEAARRAHAEAFAAAARARSAGELAEAERLYQRAQAQMDAARDSRKQQQQAAAQKAREEAWNASDPFYRECAQAAHAALHQNEELDNLMKKFGGSSPLGQTFVASSNGSIRPSQPLLLKPGCKVVLKDLVSKPELNNQLAVIEKYDDSKQRYQIRIEDTGAIIALKPQNLKQITDAFRRDGALVEPPTRLRVVGTQATSLELEWDHCEACTWQLQWSSDGGLNWESASRNLEAPKVRKRNLSPGAHVLFRVRTLKDDLFSPWASCEGQTSHRSPDKSAFAAAVDSDIKKRGNPLRQSHESDDSAARGLEDAFARASAWAASASTPTSQKHHWHELVENSTGDTFFWNEASGETRWERDPAWVARRDATGEEYWVAATSPGRSPGRRRSRFRSNEGETARSLDFEDFLRGPGAVEASG